MGAKRKVLGNAILQLIRPNHVSDVKNFKKWIFFNEDQFIYGIDRFNELMTLPSVPKSSVNTLAKLSGFEQRDNKEGHFNNTLISDKKLNVCKVELAAPFNAGIVLTKEVSEEKANNFLIANLIATEVNKQNEQELVADP